jgi:bifunctional non-homologous end joining protein LigD
MSLTDYRQKRDFKASPEPQGKAGAHRGNSFVVQEHHARRLHYDFRVEIDGVLKSWAVPKGPSLNPSDKRLAVQTEDHPLEYGKFHGVIPAGHYGAGDVKIWDEGTFEPEGALSATEQINRGELKFVLHGKKLNGSFVLVKIRGKDPTRKNTGKEWLLIKHADGAAHGASRARPVTVISPASPDAAGSESKKSPTLQAPVKLPPGARRASMPEKNQPALATLTDKPFSGPDWLFEIKWDGIRTLAEIRDGKTRLWARSGRDITSEYPELADLVHHVAGNRAWLDGEIVALDSDGKSDFERLQSRFGVRKPSAELMEEVPIVYYVFDILYFDEQDLRGAPLLERKEFLKQVLRGDARVRYSDHVVEKGGELYEVARAQHLEGIIAKKIASPYPQGRASTWVKIKLAADVDAVVGGWTDPRGSREYFGALLVGLYEKDRLEYIGNVGTGFSVEVQKRLWSQLQDLRVTECPFALKPVTREQAFWIKPELVARVKIAGWTDSRHLRAPRFLGLQADRDPKSCTFEEQMKQAPAVAREPDDMEPPSKRKRQPGDSGRETKPPQRSITGSEVELTTEKRIEEELARGSSDNVFIELDGRRLRFTNLNKVYFPEDEYTKRDLLAYYYHVAPLILPFLKDRPLVLRRYPNGIHGEAFFQKDAGKGTPAWVKTVPIESEDKGKSIQYIVANDRATLLYLTNLGCIDHNPWSSRYDDPEHPDYIFFDLDPTEGTPFETVIKVARDILSTIEQFDLTAFAKTSGATGFHIYMPVEPRYTYEQARLFVQAIASLVAKKHPGVITSERTVRKRARGTIYMDAHQNSQGQSLASVYSVRAFPHAPVSGPMRKSELSRVFRPEKWNLRSMARRIKEEGDLWAGFWRARQSLESMLKHADVKV